MKAAIIVFPGSNCDRDATSTLQRAWCGVADPADAVEPTGNRSLREEQGDAVQPLAAKAVVCAAGDHEITPVWHGDSELPPVDLVVVPGGFSYGDYLRSGAMAAHSPVMQEVVRHAERGGFVLGICNGFQILTESGLLPGTLMRNRDLKFICKETHLRVETVDSPFTRSYRQEQLLTIPIAHHDGNYYADDTTIAQLNGEGRVAFRYVDANGEPAESANPNGSRDNIAGILSANKRVLGMMPHPERHADTLIGNIDGLALFTGLLQAA